MVDNEATFQRYLKSISLETEDWISLFKQLFQLSLLDSGAIKLKKERNHVEQKRLRKVMTARFV
ncbi:hypothetical protein J1P26_20845 [Neobacillus sp. MM2021_6]|uniref:hypothetical protein n=1 Tax=Bacillaceae TaxID=186817 RepID=UPI00140CB6AC|nr:MULTISPECIES: hypothetical protein [Bacillaceae]MBO0962159.1 hypothetical protein [Neobacillus sp. MM2021_6]